MKKYLVKEHHYKQKQAKTLYVLMQQQLKKHIHGIKMILMLMQMEKKMKILILIHFVKKNIHYMT